MAWSFGDGFDLYAAVADAYASASYWDSGASTSATLQAGRFAGSQCIRLTATNTAALIKSSGANDAVHHIVCAVIDNSTLTGTNANLFLQLSDGATNQCCIVFRSDGAILLTSGGPTGTTLDTYTGAVEVASTWYAFEFEVVINNTTGSWAVRKNGNTSNDHALGSLNTRASANNYANKLTLGMQNTPGVNWQLDDLFWRSDASSVPWMGDIRCYTRMPASDASVQFSRTNNAQTQTIGGSTSTISVSATSARFSPYTVAYDGVIASAVVATAGSVTGNMKCAIYSSVGGVPTAVLGSSGPQASVAVGNNIFTFSPTIPVIRGQQIWLAVLNDTAAGFWSVATATTNGGTAAMSYATFPTASPTFNPGSNPEVSSITFNINTNYGQVSEPQQDGTTSYVSDNVAGHADLYGIGTIAATPASIVAVTTRGYAQKSDAGNRTLAVQIKSGSTTVASPTLVLSPSGFQWAWRTDLVDPNTSAAWTAAAVDAAQIGPTVVS